MINAGIDNEFTKSIFNDLNQEDFDLVIGDIELLSQNVTIHYVVDTYDVLEYCFPYGLDFSRTYKTMDRVGDEQLAYYYLFFQNRPILLDEYIPEIKSNARKIAHTTKGPHLLERFLSDYEKLSDDAQIKMRNELVDNCSFLISAIIYDTSPHEFFQKLLAERLLINDNSQNDDLDDASMKQAFQSAQQVGQSHEWFNAWYELNKHKYSGLLYSYVYEELQNVYRDIVAIERTILANHVIAVDKKLTSNHLFLYFSSAKRNAGFFKLMAVNDAVHKIIQPLREKYKTENYRSNSILRSQKHAYLMFLSQPENRNNYSEWIATLLKFKNFKKEYDEAALPADKERLSAFKGWKNLNMQYATGLENELVVNQTYSTPIHSKFRDNQHIAIKFLADSDFTELKIFLQDLLSNKSNQKRPKFEDSAFYKSLLSSFTLQDRFSDILKFLKAEKTIIIKPGDDHIVGLYHHLPLLLNYREGVQVAAGNSREGPSRAVKLIYDISKFAALSEEKRKEDSINFIDKIIDYLNSRDNIDEENTPKTKLLNLMLLQIAPFPDDGIQKVKENSLNYLESYYSVILKTYSTTLFNKEEGKWETVEPFLKLNDQSKNLEVEVLYLKAWFERRNKKYDESINTCKKALKICKEYDPRFHHGLFLAFYCKYLDSRTNSLDDLEIIDECLRLVVKTTRMYETNLKEPFIPVVEHLIQGTNAILHNLKQFLEATKIILIKYYNLHSDITEIVVSIKQSKEVIRQFTTIRDNFLTIEPDLIRSSSLVDVSFELLEAENRLENASYYKKPMNLHKKDFRTNREVSEFTFGMTIDLFDKAIFTLNRAISE